MAQSHPVISPGVAALYRKKPDEIHFIARIQNDVFGYTENGEEYILRLTPGTHRSTEQVMAEIEWVNYLLGQGVPAAQPVASVTGNFCTAVERDGISYTAVAFKRVPGEIGSEQYWIPPVFQQWGRLTGRMHKVTREYQPSHLRRPPGSTVH
jgi:amicoumacin kinase